MNSKIYVLSSPLIELPQVNVTAALLGASGITSALNLFAANQNQACITYLLFIYI